MLELGTCVTEGHDTYQAIAEGGAERRARTERLIARGLSASEISVLTGYKRSTVMKLLKARGVRFPAEARLSEIFDALLIRLMPPNRVRRGFELIELCDAMDCLLCGIDSQDVVKTGQAVDMARYRGVMVAVGYGFLGLSLAQLGRRWDCHHTTLMALVRHFAEARGWQSDCDGFRRAVHHHADALRPACYGAAVVV